MESRENSSFNEASQSVQFPKVILLRGTTVVAFAVVVAVAGVVAVVELFFSFSCLVVSDRRSNDNNELVEYECLIWGVEVGVVGGEAEAEEGCNRVGDVFASVGGCREGLLLLGLLLLLLLLLLLAIEIKAGEELECFI